MWVVVSYYNPQQLSGKKKHFELFRTQLLRSEIKLLVVEVSLSNSFELSNADCDVHLGYSTTSILWHKERALNLGISHLQDKTEIVTCCDIDIIFHDDDWVPKVSHLLKRFQAAQPFSEIQHLAKGVKDISSTANNVIRSDTSFMERYRLNDTYFDGKEGPISCGYVWSFQMSFISKVGWYERDIVGGADKLMAHALTELSVPKRTALSPAHHQDQLVWLDLVKKQRPKASVLEGTISHLWHGAPESRQKEYRNGHEILCENDFNPLQDIYLDGEFYRWRENNSNLEKGIQNYFRVRGDEYSL